MIIIIVIIIIIIIIVLTFLASGSNVRRRAGTSVTAGKVRTRSTIQTRCAPTLVDHGLAVATAVPCGALTRVITDTIHTHTVVLTWARCTFIKVHLTQFACVARLT